MSRAFLLDRVGTLQRKLLKLTKHVKRTLTRLLVVVAVVIYGLSRLVSLRTVFFILFWTIPFESL